MSENEIGRLIYLVVLLIAIGGSFLLSSRQNLGKTMQQLSIWGMIFLGFIAGYGLWSDIRSDLSPRQSVFEDSGRIEVPRSFDGHYYLTVTINDTEVDFVVDTGATSIVLSRADARKAGFSENDLRFTGQASTANGMVRTAPVRLDTIAIGPIVDRNVRAWVNEGDLDTSLLGMAYLQRFDTVTFNNGTLILQR
ncbi:retropepsin-like aspartic protease family protein [Actibacterium pelagium]|uniref:Aspartyl protease n=1 Tax=Actibacterium pelagium TaxID=2029103 RepID=A0A917EHK4_9RHOB|nr:TIGR02281 family clan AA aspartic protease [Actibacterium pelagium]GGE44673.1 aspartyl protease [Actibacterium pelagium]